MEHECAQTNSSPAPNQQSMTDRYFRSENGRTSKTARSMIDIQHPHSHTDADLRHLVQSLADKLAERYDISHSWQGSQLTFQRTGVDGVIALEPESVRITAHLAFPFSMMESMVENEIQRLLTERLG